MKPHRAGGRKGASAQGRHAEEAAGRRGGAAPAGPVTTILVLNGGSSSVKLKLIEMPAERLLARARVERIGEARGRLELHAAGDEASREAAYPDHRAALEAVTALLRDDPRVPLESLEGIDMVGHRVVHGGDAYRRPAAVTPEVLTVIRRHVPLAPLHNPANLAGIEILQELLPRARHVAVFDTAFHHTLPEHAFLYALPLAMHRRDGIRRYGFHGISHQYVARRAASLLRRPIERTCLITCHLGNGASLAAVDAGRSVDTTMGLTPLEGLVMGTRSGDLDPGVVLHLLRQNDCTVETVDDLLNTRSGLLGLSGTSRDVRELLHRRAQGDDAAALALKVFVYRIRKYIGAYCAVLGGLDALVFTAGIGENAPTVREEICHGLEHLGIVLDEETNRSRTGCEADIAAASSATRVLVIPTDEELMIARETHALATAPADTGQT